MNYLAPTTLETERLHLRICDERDWSDLHAYYSDPECQRYTSGKPLSETESWRKMAALIGHWQIRKYGSYALEEKSSGKVIGVGGLEFPKGWPDTEIQYGLSQQFWGKGYAGEAITVIRKMVKQFLPTIQPISIIHPENSGSIKLAKAAGAVFEKEFLFRDTIWLVYRHTTI